MAVTHSPTGFTGQIDEVAWSKLISSVTPRFRVASNNDWALSVSGTTARTINIAAGSGTACGVQDTTTAGDTVSFAANSGGSDRYDALVARYVWGSDTVAFAAIQGTTSPPSVNTTTTVDNTKINRIPGVQYDALLAVVQIRPSVGNFASGDLFDMRPYGGLSGPVMLPNSTYLSLVDARAGAEVYAADTSQRWLTTDGSTWSWPPEAQGEIGRTEYVGGGTTTLANTQTGLPSLTVTTSLIPANRRLEIVLSGVVAVDSGSGGYAFYIWQGAVSTGTLRRGYTVQVATSGVRQGFTASVVTQTTSQLTNQQWTVSGEREAGTGTFSLYTRGTEGPAQLSVRDLGAV